MTNEEAIRWLDMIKKYYIYGGDEAYDKKRMKAVDKAIKALEAQPMWIPVSERLPMMGDTFLVTIEYKGEVIGVDAASYSPVEGYIDKHWDTFNDWKEDDDSCYHVTAWMPLPEPYKEDAEC